MGLYVNPVEESKESFLKREGTPIPPVDTFVKDDTAVPICWLDNGPFTAAIVVYAPRELKRVRYADGDGRAKRWFTVPLDKLVPVVRGLRGEPPGDVVAAFAAGDDW